MMAEARRRRVAAEGLLHLRSTAAAFALVMVPDGKDSFVALEKLLKKEALG